MQQKRQNFFYLCGKIQVNCSVSETHLHRLKIGNNQKSLFFTHSLKSIFKFEVRGRSKVDQGCSAIFEGGPLCPSIWVELFDACFQPIGFDLGSSYPVRPNQS